MVEKSRIQQFWDTRCRDNKILGDFTPTKWRNMFRFLGICGFISTLAYVSASNIRKNDIEFILLPNQISLTNNEYKFSQESKLRDKMPRYNCTEIKQLLEEGKFARLEELYPDVDIELSVTTVAGDNIILHRRPLLNCLEPDHPYLIKIIESSLVAPENPPIPYYLANTTSLNLESNHQALDVMEMVYKDNMTGGFFLEGGALNCESSVTLPLEANFGWKGLLVELVPDVYNMCLDVGRRSHIINTCFGAEKSPHFIDFDIESGIELTNGNKTGKSMAGFASKNPSNTVLTVQCFPVYSLLLSMGNPTVNLFVLDIEGYELAILRTIPWNKVDIEVISVETDLAGIVQIDSSPELITKFLEDQGYTKFRHRNDYNELTGQDQNSLFVRNDVVKARNVKQL